MPPAFQPRCCGAPTTEVPGGAGYGAAALLKVCVDGQAKWPTM
jgi:hypothetical protein